MKKRLPLNKLLILRLRSGAANNNGSTARKPPNMNHRGAGGFRGRTARHSPATSQTFSSQGVQSYGYGSNASITTPPQPGGYSTQRPNPPSSAHRGFDRSLHHGSRVPTRPVDVIDWLRTGPGSQLDPNNPNGIVSWSRLSPEAREHVLRVARYLYPQEPIGLGSFGDNGDAATVVFNHHPFLPLTDPTPHLVIIVPIRNAATPTDIPPVGQQPPGSGHQNTHLQREPPAPRSAGQGPSAVASNTPCVCPCPFYHLEDHQNCKRTCKTKHKAAAHMISHLIHEHNFTRRYHDPRIDGVVQKPKRKEPCYIFRTRPAWCAVCIYCYEGFPTEEALQSHVTHPPQCENHQNIAMERKLDIVSAEISRSAQVLREHTPNQGTTFSMANSSTVPSPSPLPQIQRGLPIVNETPRHVAHYAGQNSTRPTELNFIGAHPDLSRTPSQPTQATQAIFTPSIQAPLSVLPPRPFSNDVTFTPATTPTLLPAYINPMQLIINNNSSFQG